MVDRFGIPDLMFGDVPDDFYGLVGRIALVATLLEDRVLGLLWALDDEPQATHAGLSTSQLIPKIRERTERHAKALGDDLVDDIESTLVAAAEVLDQRHALIHSLWPQPTLEKAQGWRSKRVPKSERRRLGNRLDRNLRRQAPGVLGGADADDQCGAGADQQGLGRARPTVEGRRSRRVVEPLPTPAEPRPAATTESRTTNNRIQGSRASP